MENNFDSIKIYPEWNVNKKFNVFVQLAKIKLKSIQSGM